MSNSVCASGVEKPKVPTISTRQPEAVIDKPEVDFPTQETDELSSSYPVRGGRLAKMIEVVRCYFASDC